MGSQTIKLLICGSGNGAHVLAGIASSLEGTEVRVLTLSPDKADRWSAAMQTKNLEVTLKQRGKEAIYISSQPTLVTKSPADAMWDVNIVVFLLHAVAHQSYLDAIKPYVQPGVIIVGLPGAPGFEFQVRDVLGDSAKQCTIMNFESLPWVCRTTEFGAKCKILSIKKTLLGAIKVSQMEVKGEKVCLELEYLCKREINF